MQWARGRPWISPTGSPGWTCSIRHDRVHLLNGNTGGAACTPCRWAQLQPSTSGTASWSRPASPSPTFPGVEASGRSGATGQPLCAPWRDDIWGVGLDVGRAHTELFSSISTTHLLTRTAARHRRPGARADQGPDATRDLRKGCTRPTRDWTNRQQQGVPRADRGDDATLSIRPRSSTTADDYYRTPPPSNGRRWRALSSTASTARGLQEAARRRRELSLPRRGGWLAHWLTSGDALRHASWSTAFWLDPLTTHAHGHGV